MWNTVINYLEDIPPQQNQILKFNSANNSYFYLKKLNADSQGGYNVLFFISYGTMTLLHANRLGTSSLKFSGNRDYIKIDLDTEFNCYYLLNESYTN